MTQCNRDGALGVGLREWRHLVLQRSEVARQLRADHIRPGRQELAELDVGGTEAREGCRETVGGDAARWPLDQTCDAQRRPCRQRQPGRVDEAEDALAREHETGVTEAVKVGQPCDHNRQPECSATMPPVMRWNDTRVNPASRIISANASGRGKRRIDSTRYRYASASSVTARPSAGITLNE